MTKLSAKQIVLLSVQSSGSLSKILEFAKVNCSEEEYSSIHKSVAEVSATIFQLLVQPQIQRFPEIEVELDQHLN